MITFNRKASKDKKKKKKKKKNTNGKPEKVSKVKNYDF